MNTEIEKAICCHKLTQYDTLSVQALRRLKTKKVFNFFKKK